MVHRKNIVLKFIKPVFILVLLTIYFYLVARPSIDKYFEGGVLTKDETPNSTYRLPRQTSAVFFNVIMSQNPPQQDTRI